jgi:hypothetical protein
VTGFTGTHHTVTQQRRLMLAAVVGF